MSATSYSVNLEERTLFEGYCSLQYGPATSWITAFRFNISNDGTQYSENYTVYVYQSQCQTFQNDSGVINFSLQVGDKSNLYILLIHRFYGIKNIPLIY